MRKRSYRRASSLLGFLCFLALFSVGHAEIHFYHPPNRFDHGNLNSGHELAPAQLLDLNGPWDYRLKDRTGTIGVPCSYSGYEGKVTFQKKFVIPADWRGMTVILESWGMHQRGSFYLNNSLIGSRQSSGLPFQITLPPQFLHFGAENELVIEVDNSLAARTSLPLRSALFGPRNYGGITREFFLTALPRENIADIQVRDSLSAGGTIILQTFSDLQLDYSEVPAELTIEVFDEAGIIVAQQQTTLAAIKGSMRIQEPTSLRLEAPHYWRPGAPYLYRMVCTLVRGESVLDRLHRPVGLTDPAWGWGQNTEVIQALPGIGRVEQWPESGICASQEQLLRDLLLLREAGVNTVRCCYSYPHPRFLDLCDSLGIGVLLELPLYGVSDRLLQKPEVGAAAQAAMKDLQAFSASHPSVLGLGWGSGFEGQSVNEDGIVHIWAESVPSPLPYYATTVEMVEKPPAMQVIVPGPLQGETPRQVIPSLPAYMGMASGNQGEMEQSRRLGLLLQNLPAGSKSFFVAYQSDWTGEYPLMWNPPGRGLYQHTAGLSNDRRRSRMSFLRLKEFLRTGELDASRSAREEETPWQFLLFPVALTALGLWFIRIDRLWRRNLRRALSHPHGLFSDIRNRRFLPGTQTSVLGLLVASGMGNLWASQVYHWRLNPGFSALLSHLLRGDSILAFLRITFWTPWQGVLFGMALALAVALGFALLIRIGCRGQRPRLTLMQCFHLILWAGVPALILLPLSALYLRLEGYTIFQVAIWLLSGISLVWSYLRLLKAMRVSCRRRWQPLTFGLGMPALFIVIYLVRLQATRETLDYLAYFYKLFLQG